MVFLGQNKTFLMMVSSVVPDDTSCKESMVNSKHVLANQNIVK